MAIVTFPATILPTVCSWGVRSITESFTSPLNGTVQTAERPGARWKASLEFGMLNLTQGRQLQGFLAAMDGNAGRCNLINHDRPGTGSNCTVVGGGQVGSALLMQSTSNRWFYAGDYFSVNGEFKMVTEDVQANGAGQATVKFSPMLRASPANAATVTFTSPTCQMMLDQSEFMMPRISGPRYSGVTVPLIEVFQ